MKPLPTLAVALVATTAGMTVGPAFGGTASSSKLSLNARVARLERRVNALARLAVLMGNNPHLADTSITFSFAQTGADGSATGEAFCTSGDVITGGGAEFLAPQVGDSIIYSYPSGNAWDAAARKANGGSGTLEVYAVCASKSGD